MTYIQRTFLNERYLNKFGLHITKSGLLDLRSVGTFSLAHALQSDRWDQFSKEQRLKFISMWSDLRLEIINCNHNLVLVADEILSWEFCYIDQLEFVKKTLCNFNVIIIFCFGNCYKLINSMHGQILGLGVHHIQLKIS